ncbi:MAG: polysaccharide export protein [Rhodospirillales bacterium]|nr:polysaccharide export protein [Rhodospirillales bacterium]MDE2198460.1 polysaccharide export protein [Rhodospirillales bacterium]MDE2577120.1 polysaccharide export protein [Rhodospirillales bacterium]
MTRRRVWNSGRVTARRVLAQLLSVALLAGCASQIGPQNAATVPATPVGAAGSPTGAVDPTNQQYVIGAGDQLGISVYRAPELSVPSLPVRPDGRISMPLIPDIVAAGKTPTQLGKELTERLKEYVKDPIVTVMVTNFVGPFSRQVRVIGEATAPQAIPYRNHMTVLDVMIAVKGLTKYAAGNSAVIIREVNGKSTKIPVHLSDLLKDGDIGQNVEMQPGDTLIIPQSWF